MPHIAGSRGSGHGWGENFFRDAEWRKVTVSYLKLEGDTARFPEGAGGIYSTAQTEANTRCQEWLDKLGTKGIGGSMNAGQGLNKEEGPNFQLENWTLYSNYRNNILQCGHWYRDSDYGDYHIGATMYFPPAKGGGMDIIRPDATCSYAEDPWCPGSPFAPYGGIAWASNMTGTEVAWASHGLGSSDAWAATYQVTFKVGVAPLYP